MFIILYRSFSDEILDKIQCSVSFCELNCFHYISMHKVWTTESAWCKIDKNNENEHQKDFSRARICDHWSFILNSNAGIHFNKNKSRRVFFSIYVSFCMHHVSLRSRIGLMVMTFVCFGTLPYVIVLAVWRRPETHTNAKW